MTERQSLATMTIVLVDADPWIRDSLSLYFARKVRRFAAFSNVSDGMRAVVNGPVDIVVCDYGMTGMDGLTFLRLAGACHPEAVRILTTGYPSGGLCEIAEREGILGCIQKPFTIEEFESTLAELLGATSAEGEPLSGSAAE